MKTISAAKSVTGGQENPDPGTTADDAAARTTAAYVATHPLSGPVPLNEVEALIRYALEKSKDPKGCRELYERIEKLQTLPGDAASSRSEANALRAEILERYGELTKETEPVTGRTILETRERFSQDTRPLRLWTLTFLIFAVGNEVMEAWLGELPEPEEGWLLYVLDFRRYVLEYCVPFLWGALGSLAYLLKRLSDVAEDQTYDSATSHGWTARVFLGAMLGGLMQFLFDPQIFGDGAIFKVSNVAIGFFTGVGVKIVYGAIEKTVEVLAEKLNLDANRPAAAAKKKKPEGERQPETPPADAVVKNKV